MHKGERKKGARVEKSELKALFKTEMSGLKLSKKITLRQAKWIVRALEVDPELCDCLYKKVKPIDRQKIASQLEQFRANWPGPRTSGWKETERALISADLKADEFTEVLKGLGREADYRGIQKRKGKWLPEWKHPAPWIRSRRWEAEFVQEKVKMKSPGMTAAEATAKIFEEQDQARNNRVIKSFKEQLSNARQQL